MRLTLVCSRPAVSTSTRSASRLAAELMASNTTEPGSAPSWPRTISAPTRLGPVRELLGGGGAERVGGGEHDACGRRRSRAARPWRWSWSCPTPFTPTNIHTFGSPAVVVERAVAARRRAARPAPSCSSVDQRVGVGDPLGSRARSRRSSRMRVGGGHADVGEQQRLLELVPGLVVDRARPRTAASAGERGAGLAQPVAERGASTRRPLDDGLDDRSRPRPAPSTTTGSVRGRRRWRRRRPAAPAARGLAGRRRCERRDRPSPSAIEHDREHEDRG